ncbi:MAG: endolytic transglycosylase MltG [Bacteroidota bacterium]
MKTKWIIISLIVLAILATAGYFAHKYYQFIYGDNTQLPENTEHAFVYIPGSSSYQMVKDSIAPLLKDTDAFDWVAEKKGYPAVVKSGRYKIEKGMSNNEIINLLRSGKQTPIDISFTNLRNLNQLAGKVSEKLEPDSADFSRFFHNDSVAESYGFDEFSFPAMFIPNTYNFFWDTDVNEFTDRMKKEYHRFWTQTRMEKAEKAGLNPVQVSTLASIVEKESIKNNEKPRIAGVYINRLQKGMPLQADPTLVFAIGDFSLRRVLNKHKKIDSPYNTYLNPGLPPGPIGLPEISSIDAVLNYEDHGYYFFCAKPDNSGYHDFSKTYAQHRQYAREYQRTLDMQRIYK